MNQQIYIENAKVVKKGKYSYGNNDGREWASINLKIEWQYEYEDANHQKQTGTQSAVVRCSGDLAIWARDCVTEGNKYAPTPIPYTFLNLWLRMYGEFREAPRKDGNGTWEDISNMMVVDFANVVENAKA